MKGIRLTCAVGILLFVACGGGSTSPTEACDEVNEAVCTQIYKCYTATQIAAAGYPANEAACVTMSEASAGCAAKTEANTCTGGNQVYHGENVEGCVDQLNGLTCAEVVSNTDVMTSAPKCDDVCITPT
jgi:hypothetical protein